MICLISVTIHLSRYIRQKIISQTPDNAYLVHINDIFYLEAEGSYTKFITETHKEILVSKKIAHYEFLEKMPHFLRSHRRFIVNLNKIKRVDKKNFAIEMLDSKEIYLAQDKKMSFFKKSAHKKRFLLRSVFGIKLCKNTY